MFIQIIKWICHTMSRKIGIWSLAFLYFIPTICQLIIMNNLKITDSPIPESQKYKWDIIPLFAV